MDRKLLFDTLVYNSDEIAEAVHYKVERMKQNSTRYAAILPPVKWWLIAVIHELECSQDFSKHLHNGDSLKARTVHVPAGRPITGEPPFTFMQSAVDALHLTGADKITDYNIGDILYFLEGYNGYGYAKYHNMPSPYLWAGSNHYIKGKYTADGKFNPDAVSNQIGVALLLKQLPL